jgi:hypothetical protein
VLSPLQQTPENTKWDQIQDSRTNEMVFCKPGQKLKINNCRLSKHTRKGNIIKNHGSKIAWFLSAKVYDQAKLRHVVHEKWNMKHETQSVLVKTIIREIEHVFIYGSLCRRGYRFGNIHNDFWRDLTHFYRHVYGFKLYRSKHPGVHVLLGPQIVQW